MPLLTSTTVAVHPVAVGSLNVTVPFSVSGPEQNSEAYSVSGDFEATLCP